MDMTDDPLASVDADELEADIDKAIDELFVQKGAAPEPAPAEEEPPEVTVVEEVVEEPAPELAAEPVDDPLAGLKESLLTLDWEINTENIQDFEKEIQVVSGKVSHDRHGMAVVKMTVGVLKYLHAKKGSASPISVQFLHSATRGLDIFLREPPPSDTERSQVMDKLLGQFRRLKAEIQKLKPVATIPPAEEAPIVPDPSAEPSAHVEPVLEELPKEEPVLEELPVEAPILEEVAAEEPFLEKLPEEEPVLEELLEEEPAMEELLEEEPFLERLPEEEPLLQELLEEEPAMEELPEEEPLLEEFLEEEPFLEKLPEEEPVLEELLEEEPAMEELLEEKPAFGPEEAIPAATAVRPESEAPWPELTQEARDRFQQLSNSLHDLRQETYDFFNRLLKAMAGKPALKRVENHFANVHKRLEEKLTDTQMLSGALDSALNELEQSVDEQQVDTLSPEAQAHIDSQVKIVQDAVERFAQAAAQLRQSFTDRAIEPSPSTAAESAAPTGADTAEFSLEAGESLEDLGAEPLVELVEEVPSEATMPAPAELASIYLANVADSTLGIPTDVVANGYKVSKGKLKAIRKRGYAKLTDFKVVFRSIKLGITGPLAGLKLKALKKIEFPIITLSPETLGSDDSEAKVPSKGIVLLSTGECHGALLTDEVMQQTPYDLTGYRKAGLPGEVSGTATIEGDFEINVIDPDYVLS